MFLAVIHTAREFARKIYRSKRWEKTRILILKRDKYLCQICGEPAIEVHHKKHLTPGNINNEYIVYGEKNLISLCRDCHIRQHDRVLPQKRKDDNVCTVDYVFDKHGMIVKKKI